MGRTIANAKLIRITAEAHHSAKAGAAISGQTLEAWASDALVEMSKQALREFQAPRDSGYKDMQALTKSPARTTRHRLPAAATKAK
jgi:hypothetical protein